MWNQEALAWLAAGELLGRYLETVRDINNDIVLIRRMLEDRQSRAAIAKWNSVRSLGSPIFLVEARQVNRVSSDSYTMFLEEDDEGQPVPSVPKKKRTK